METTVIIPANKKEPKLNLQSLSDTLEASIDSMPWGRGSYQVNWLHLKYLEISVPEELSTMRIEITQVLICCTLKTDLDITPQNISEMKQYLEDTLSQGSSDEPIINIRNLGPDNSPIWEINIDLIYETPMETPVPGIITY